MSAEVAHPDDEETLMARQRRTERVDHTQLGGSLFLGAVVARPTGDEEAPMAAEFSLLVARVNQLLNRYHAGEIGGLQLAEALAEERVVDIAGGEWTLGATSGAWYRRMPSMDWAQVPPPGPNVKARVKLVVSEAGTVHDTSAPADVFAELYGEHADADVPAAAADTEWMGDASPDAGWVAETPLLDGLTEVYGAQLPPPPTPPTPVGNADRDLDPLAFLGGDPVGPDGDPDAGDDGPELTEADVEEFDADALLRRWLDTPEG